MNSAARNCDVLVCGLRRTLVLIAVAAMVIPTGCSWFKKKKTTHTGEDIGVTQTQTPRPAQTGDTPPEDAQRVGPRPGDLAPYPEMQVIYFDFDRAEIRPDQLSRLEANLRYLTDHPQDKVYITGHCDERGTNEYNLSLGERRAAAVRQYLIRGGVDPNRIGMTSKGEEEPVALGHDEESWSRNRRCEFQKMF